MRPSTEEFRILSATAILGYGFPESSFRKGLARKPHLIAADAGSSDPGPYYLGSGKPFTSRAGVKRDLRLMIREGVKRGIPVVIGTAGGSGARPHVEWCEQIVEEIAREEKLRFTLGVIYTDVSKVRVRKAMEARGVRPLPCVPKLTPEALDATTHIVAQVGVQPIIRALAKGCDVVVCGRAYDPAVFAALPISLGYDPGLALHLGKILECAAIAATPGSGSDCVLGVLRKDAFVLETLSKERRFTAQSTAAHTLYEKSDPYHLHGPGGEIDLTDCSFTELDGGRVEVCGSRFVPTKRNWLKLEGARPVGFRAISIAGVRDPIMIGQIDSILAAVERQVASQMRRENLRGKVHFHTYGRNGVMGPLEPTPSPAHELCILLDAVGDTQHDADSLLAMTRSTLLHYGYPNRIATAGNLAFPFSPSDVAMGPTYTFSVYHLIELDESRMFHPQIRQIG